MDCNPFLKKGAAGARGALETPLNIEWQTRAAPPSEFENRLGDALETVFADGTQALAEVVARLNAMHVLDAQGRAWTEASFQEAMRRLGA